MSVETEERLYIVIHKASLTIQRLHLQIAELHRDNKRLKEAIKARGKEVIELRHEVSESRLM